MTSWEKMEEHHITALKEAEKVMRELAMSTNYWSEQPEFIPTIYALQDKAIAWLKKWCDDEGQR